MKLLNMLPSLNVNNIANSCPTNIVRISQCLLGGSIGAASNLSHDLFSQFCMALARASCCICPPPFVPIMRVIHIRSSLKVGRITARRVITFMSYQQPFWDWTTRQLKRNSVSRKTFFLPVDDSTEYPVSLLKTCAAPRPTLVKLGDCDLFPEPFTPALIFEIPIAFLGAIFTRLRAYCPRSKCECAFAVFADTSLRYDFGGWHVLSLLKVKNVLARPAQSLQRLRGPLCILAREGIPCR